MKRWHFSVTVEEGIKPEFPGLLVSLALFSAVSMSIMLVRVRASKIFLYEILPLFIQSLLFLC